ncbi:hypothetical protein CJ030_MR0G011040 [Morella rubra]|uniref:Uncharacterized protein n=1 Tax=Morella rubra TaxID=262757 RepID=A0A6A1UHZ8_9ROSI|nr:hypothetical protein CJ030_MR0G011039 [Morella rubra]KAB1199881.1 hypothetical protein CJ030_MR0G011040 [Morella rubra]
MKKVEFLLVRPIPSEDVAKMVVKCPYWTVPNRPPNLVGPADAVDCQFSDPLEKLGDRLRVKIELRDRFSPQLSREGESKLEGNPRMYSFP